MYRIILTVNADDHPCECCAAIHGRIGRCPSETNSPQFVGDIGQPLHCENLDLGGNEIDVTYNGDDTNLHAVWDTQIPEAISGGSSLADAKTWASTLTTGASLPILFAL